MAIIRFRDENGEVKELTALRGEKGDKGDRGDYVLVVTEQNGETSHSSDEIYEAYQAGHAVFLKINNRLIPIGGANASTSFFYDVKVGYIGAKTTEYSVSGNLLVITNDAYSPPVDTSLTQKYVPADAFTVGDRFAKANKTYANALKGTASGEIVCLDDISPLSQEVTVSVSADVGMLKVYGKNLFDYSGWVDSGHITVNDETTGEFTFRNVSSISAAAKKIPALPNTAYRISGYVKDTVAGHAIHISPNYTDGTNSNITVTTTEEELGQWKRFEGVTSSYKTLSFVSFGGAGGLNVGTSFKEVQVELSDVETPYEPYNETQYTPNEYGDVEGVKGIYPTTTLTTDTEGGVVHVEYTKDTNTVIEKLLKRISALEAAVVNNA